MAVQLVHYRFTRAEYHRMVEAGILHEDSPVELIEGEILEMSPIGRRHKAVVDRCTRAFTQRVGDRAIVRVQSSVVLSDRCEPQPDLVLLRPRDDFYAESDETPADVLLIVEVADSSEGYDRQVKAPLYARYGIPELWIVNLVRDHVAVYRAPTPDGYATTQIARRDDRIEPLLLPGVSIAVADILP